MQLKVSLGLVNIYTLVLTPSGTSTINVSIPANAVTRDGGSEQNSAFSGNITYSAFPTNGLLLNLDAGASGAVSEQVGMIKKG